MDFPFTTDGCSGGMTWLWRKVMGTAPPWNDCCIEHDKSYWSGGSMEDRLWADTGLLIKVAQGGHPFVGIIMFLAVRAGGHPLIPTSWRWGYGWKYPRGYTRKDQQ